MTSLRARTWTCWVRGFHSLELLIWLLTIGALQREGEERRDCRKIRQLHCVQPDTPLTAALSLLLEAGVSVLPVVDQASRLGVKLVLAAIIAERNICTIAESPHVLRGRLSCITLKVCLPVPADGDRSAMQEGRLLDMYARSDITALAKGNSYSRLQWEEVTVGQALSLAQQPAQVWRTSGSACIGRLPTPQGLGLFSSLQRACCACDLKRWQSGAYPCLAPSLTGPAVQVQVVDSNQGNAAKSQRVHLCTARDTLR